MRATVFWKRVKILLREKNLSQGEAARACGRPLSTVKRWMAKDIIPPLDNAFYLAQFLGVSLEYLILGKENFALKTNREAIAMLKEVSEKLARLKCP